MPEQPFAQIEVLVEAVKERQGIPHTDASRDDRIRVAAEDALDHVLRITRYSLLESEGVVDLHRQIQVDRPFLLSRRPVDEITELVGKEHGGTWAALGYDLLDAEEGLVVLTGQTAAVPAFARPAAGAPWERWKDPIWPAVKVTYKTAQAALPAELAGAIVSLAAHWWQLDCTGPVRSSSMGGLSQTFDDRPIPLKVGNILATYQKGKKALAI